MEQVVLEAAGDAATGRVEQPAAEAGSDRGAYDNKEHDEAEELNLFPVIDRHGIHGLTDHIRQYEVAA